MRVRPSPGSLYALLGKRIADARSKRSGGSWSQGRLAKACRLSRGSIANIELGRQHAPIHTIWQIGTALGIEPRLLLPTVDELRDSAASLDAPRLQAWISTAESELSGVRVQHPLQPGKENETRYASRGANPATTSRKGPS